MKKIVKCFLIIFIFILILLTSLHIASRIFIPKWLENEDNMYTWIKKGFYEEKNNSLDLLFVGNSDVYRGVSPMVLWDEYGIPSYAYGGPGQRVWTGYYMMKEALEYQHPKVVIFDVDAAFSNDHSAKSNYRKVFDNMSPNKVKWEAINDKVFEFSWSEKLSFYFPIFRYHSRYSSLTKADFEYAFSNYHFAYKGLDMTAKIKPYKKGFEYMKEKGETIQLPNKVKNYLDKIVTLCKEKDIPLVLMELPSAVSWSLAKSNAISLYAKENNLEFIDFNLNPEETEFDWLIDSSDGGDHLNVQGAEKITKFLGTYLTERFDFIDRRNDENYKMWHEDSEKYNKDKEERIRQGY